MSTTYAKGTGVHVDRSRAAIEAELRALGARAFLHGGDGIRDVLVFEANDYRVRFDIPLARPTDRDVRLTPTGRPRTAAQVREMVEAARRSQWRALLLIIKAKRVAIESGIVTFFQEFSPWIVLPDGSTVSQWLEPQVRYATSGNAMPPLLPGGPSTPPAIES